MMLTILSFVSCAFALIPAYVFWRNFAVFRRLPTVANLLLNTTSASEESLACDLPPMSVLIPARNEESSIGPCIESVLANKLELEVVVLDDHSEDATADRVQTIADVDPRVRLTSTKSLPAGWCGKQHACYELSKLAKHELLVFLDADVRLSGDALIRIASEYQTANVDLLSGFPRQRTESFAERLLIPLIHFVLLGFLSLRRMRGSTHPAFGAGCGQLFITSREAYERSGGHAAIRRSLHDGIKLPRSYRSAGLMTDLFDATDIATCRMYRNAAEVWNGLKKNATEGVANASLIVPVTLLLLLGQVLPFCILAYSFVRPMSALQTGIVVTACCLALLPRFFAASRYRQSLLGALLHPIAIVLFLAIQWSAFLGSFSKRAVSWKGRPYVAS